MTTDALATILGVVIGVLVSIPVACLLARLSPPWTQYASFRPLDDAPCCEVDAHEPRETREIVVRSDYDDPTATHLPNAADAQH